MSGFDPSRFGLSNGATRALLRHKRRDGGLFGSFLGDEDAEELWFCSMLRVASGGEPLVRRMSSTSSLGGSICYTYYLTDAGVALHDAIATDARRAETGNTDSVHEGAGPEGIAQTQSGHHPKGNN